MSMMVLTSWCCSVLVLLVDTEAAAVVLEVLLAESVTAGLEFKSHCRRQTVLESMELLMGSTSDLSQEEQYHP